MRSLGLLLVIACCCVGAVWFYGPSTKSSLGDSIVPSGTSKDPDLPTPIERDVTFEPARASATPEGANEQVVVAVPAVALVAGRLIGISSEINEAGLVKVRKIGGGSQSTVLRSDRNGRFDLNLASVGVAGGGYAASNVDLIFEASVPGFLPTVELLEVRDWAAHSTYRGIGIEIPMEKAAAEVRGVVALPPGRSSEPLEVIVAAFGLDALGQPGRTPESKATCGPDGAFILPLGRGSEQVVVVAFMKGLMPESVIVERRSISNLRIPLSLGNTLSGVVGMSIGEGASVNAMILEQDPGERHWMDLVWIGQRFELGQARTIAGPGGIFTFGGLAAVPYSVRLDLVPKTITFSDVSVEAIPPATGLLIGDGCSHLTVRVHADSSPLPGATVVLSTTELIPGTPISIVKVKSMTTAGEGVVRAVVDSSQMYRLDVKMDRYSNYSEENLSLLAEGEHEIEVQLKPVLLGAQLELVLENDPGVPFTVHLALSPTEAGAGAPQIERTARGGGDPITLHDLTPGNYEVHASPTYGTSMAGFLMDESFTVELSPGQRTVEHVFFRTGGRIRIDSRKITSATQGQLTVAIQDMAQATPNIHFRSRGLVESQAGDYSVAVKRHYGDIPLATTVESFPALAPGKYSLVYSFGGGAEFSTPFEIREGQLTEVDLDASLVGPDGR